MVTIDHLRDAWEYALFEINASIFHLEGDSTAADDNSQRAADAWLKNLHRDRVEYDALLADYPSISLSIEQSSRPAGRPSRSSPRKNRPRSRS